MALEMQLDVEVAITGLGEGAVQGILSGVTPLGRYTTELHTLQVGERVPFYIHLIQNHLTDVYMCFMTNAEAGVKVTLHTLVCWSVKLTLTKSRL